MTSWLAMGSPDSGVVAATEDDIRFNYICLALVRCLIYFPLSSFSVSIQWHKGLFLMEVKLRDIHKVSMGFSERDFRLFHLELEIMVKILQIQFQGLKLPMEERSWMLYPNFVRLLFSQPF